MTTSFGSPQYEGYGPSLGQSDFNICNRDFSSGRSLGANDIEFAYTTPTHANDVAHGTKTSYEKSPKGMSMSLCFAMQYGKNLYLAADSKSMRNNQPERYDYAKIALLPIEGFPIAVMSAGVNTFGDIRMDFAQAIKSIPTIAITNDSAESFKKITGIVQKHFVQLLAKTSGIVNICLFTCLKDKELIRPSQAICDVTDGKGNDIVLEVDCYHGLTLRMGATWATEYLKYYKTPDETNGDAHIIGIINEVFDKAKLLGEYFDNSVGGPIRILKLTPDGAEWLQNKPE